MSAAFVSARPAAEILELRIAPAAMLSLSITGGGHIVKYLDVDGDKVTITATGTGIFTPAMFSTGVASAAGEQLQLLDLSAGGFDAANLTFTVAKVATGDGLANVGYINSTGHDLGKVTIKGDLGQIDAGDGITTTPGLLALSARSLDRLGLDTQAAGGSLRSTITGALGALVVAGDVKEAFVEVLGGSDGKIGPVTIGGSLIGGSDSGNGAIIATGDIGAVRIGHDIQGGFGSQTGFISSGGKLAGLSIGGSLIGGAGSSSGMIIASGDIGMVKIGHDMQGGAGSNSALINSLAKLMGISIGGSFIGGATANSGLIVSTGDMGAVKIGHDVHGGFGSRTGFIKSGGKLASVTIGGSLVGGANNFSGAIFSAGDLGAVKIGHDVTGGSITGLDSLDSSGLIESFSRIASVTIGGSIISGTDTSSGALTNNATVRAGNDIGALVVKGSLIGHGDSGAGASPVVIGARGQEFPSPGVDLAIGRISIGVRVEFADILGGYTTDLIAMNGDAQIGSVKVGGDWAASNLVAGAMNAASGNTSFGDGNDASIGAGTSITAKIASITIKGQVFGTPTSVSGLDHFGFVAQQIGAVKIGGNAIVPTANPQSIGETSDMTIHLI